MKKTIFFAFLLISLSTYAQIPKLKDVKNLKSSKVIIGLSGNEALDNDLKSIIKNTWKLSEISESLPLKEAREKAKGDDNTFVLHINSVGTRNAHFDAGSNTKYIFISNGKCIALSTGKKKPLFRSFIPADGSAIPKESIKHGVEYIQQILGSMINKKQSAKKALSDFKKKSSELKNKTLYIPDFFLSKKMNESKIREIYGSNFELVNYSKWSNAILNKTTNVAYVMIIPVPLGGQYVYQHHILDAETGKVLAVLQPKAGVSLYGVNLSASNTGYINKKNVKQYNKVLSGKW